MLTFADSLVHDSGIGGPLVGQVPFARGKGLEPLANPLTVGRPCKVQNILTVPHQTHPPDHGN